PKRQDFVGYLRVIDGFVLWIFHFGINGICCVTVQFGLFDTNKPQRYTFTPKDIHQNGWRYKLLQALLVCEISALKV
ncbi:MAG: hypothetical protein ACK4UP_08260, partial [Spirosomataceae bacterium]